MPAPEITFTLTTEDFDWITEASSVLSSHTYCIESDGITVDVTFNTQDDSAHTDSLEDAKVNVISIV